MDDNSMKERLYLLKHTWTTYWLPECRTIKRVWRLHKHTGTTYWLPNCMTIKRVWRLKNIPEQLTDYLTTWPSNMYKDYKNKPRNIIWRLICLPLCQHYAEKSTRLRYSKSTKSVLFSLNGLLHCIISLSLPRENGTMVPQRLPEIC